MDFDANETPRDIVAELSLTAGRRYTAQNVSVFATLFLRESVTAPDATHRAFKIEAGTDFELAPQTGTGIYLWTDEPTGCAVVATDAP